MVGLPSPDPPLVIYDIGVRFSAWRYAVG